MRSQSSVLLKQQRLSVVLQQGEQAEGDGSGLVSARDAPALEVIAEDGHVAPPPSTLGSLKKLGGSIKNLTIGPRLRLCCPFCSPQPIPA